MIKKRAPTLHQAQNIHRALPRRRASTAATIRIIVDMPNRTGCIRVNQASFATRLVATPRFTSKIGTIQHDAPIKAKKLPKTPPP